MATLCAWECGLHLYGPQELEIYLYPIGPEYETKKMAQVDQILLARSALQPREGKYHGGHAESQGSLQPLASCVSYWRQV
jgi:hypothetical protein